MSDITELATIRNKPVINAGTHKSRNAGDVVVTDAELDDMIEGSNVLKELIKESMVTGVYRGNNVKAGFIPGPINLFHNDVLDETMKDRTKDVDWEWNKITKDGEPWMAATYTNVPQDVAKSLKRQWPIVSAEVMSLTDPDTGKYYPKVIRSTAFLDRFTPPAVKGQTDDVTVEFSEGESPVMVLYSSIETNNTTEDEDMAEKTEQAMPETGKEISELTGKLSEKDAQIAELQAERDAEAAELAELKAEREAQSKAIAELQAAQDKMESRELMTAFSGQVLTGQGAKWAMSKAFTDVVNPLLTGVKRSDVMELSGETKPARDIMKDAFQAVAEMAANGAIIVPITEMGTTPNTDPEATPPDEKTQVDELMKANPDMSRKQAFLQVNANKDITKGA